MKVRVLSVKTFEIIAEAESAKYLNKGDIFLPDGTGWDFLVVRKVCLKHGDGYDLNVMVKPLSKGARNYAQAYGKISQG